MTIIDLTQILGDKMPIYPEDKPVSFERTKSIEKEGYRDSILRTGMHVGTHIDGPAHMISKGKQINQISLDNFMGRGVVIDATNEKIIGESFIKDVEIREGDIVLVHTGWDNNYRSGKYFDDYPVIKEEVADILAKKKIKMLGVDLPSPDKFPYPVHKILFEKEILIAENLTGLNKLIKAEEIEVIALPLKIDSDSAPARVIAIVRETS